MIKKIIKIQPLFDNDGVTFPSGVTGEFKVYNVTLSEGKTNELPVTFGYSSDNGKWYGYRNGKYEELNPIYNSACEETCSKADCKTYTVDPLAGNVTDGTTGDTTGDATTTKNLTFTNKTFNSNTAVDNKSFSEVFNYDEVRKTFEELEKHFSDFADTLSEVNEYVNFEINELDGALYGDLAAKILNNWNQNASTFGDFYKNFEEWSNLVAEVSQTNQLLEDNISSTVAKYTSTGDVLRTTGKIDGVEAGQVIGAVKAKEKILAENPNLKDVTVTYSSYNKYLGEKAYTLEYTDANDNKYTYLLNSDQSKVLGQIVDGTLKIFEDGTTLKNLISNPSTAKIKETVLLSQTVNQTDGFVDYSVTSDQLKDYKSLTLSDGTAVEIRSSSSTGALYIVTSGLSSKQKNEIYSSLKNVLSPNQMVIMTTDGNTYNYDSTSKSNCSSNYSVIGMDSNGKMYAFTPSSHTELVVDNGSSNDTLLISVNGMIISNKMNIYMEEGAEVNMSITPKSNVDGGQTITEFTRVSVSNGVSESAGNEYATLNVGGDFQAYTNTPENKQNGTYINEHKTKNVVTVGDGPSENASYAKGENVVGNVSTTTIPVTISAGNTKGNQTMQATICYHHEGTRGGYESKDMCTYYEHVVTDWSSF